MYLTLEELNVLLDALDAELRREHDDLIEFIGNYDGDEDIEETVTYRNHQLRIDILHDLIGKTREEKAA